MPRNIPAALLTRMQKPVTTLCRVLKVSPIGQTPFGITSLNRDIVFDDGNGAITYRAACGYTPQDYVTKTDLSVNNSEASSLVSQYPMDGVTLEAISEGQYDGSPYVEMLIDYVDPDAGFTILGGGNIGQITTSDKLACQVELRALIQTLKQANMIDLTSITCRAMFGDSQCKMSLTWFRGVVTAIGSESDRTFTFGPPDPDSAGYTPSEEQYLTSAGYGFPAPHTFSDGTSFGFFEPGIVHWTSGDYNAKESEIESFDYATNTVTLSIPVPTEINVGDTFNIRADCAKSKAMCIERYSNIVNMRGEPEIPLGNGTDLQSPTPSA